MLLAAVLILLLTSGCSKQSAPAEAPVTETVPAEALETDDEEEWESSIEYGGKTYVKNRDLKTVLFLGIDNKDSGGDQIGRNGRSDTIILMLLNREEKTVRMLEISRDTMMDVDVYNNDGKKAFTSFMQLCMQYSYGDSPSKGCRLTKNKVSELLYGMNIDYTLALSVEGVSIIVDALGGIDMTLPEDCTQVDPTYVKGAQVHLDGKQAERFVRSRDTRSGGNDERMERQNWFLLELVRQIKNNRGISTARLMDIAAPYLETDLDVDTLDLLRNCTLSAESVKVPGQARMGEAHDEYYVDDQALREMVVELFYLPEA